MKTKVALYGRNGHHIIRELTDNKRAELVAVCAIEPEILPEDLRNKVIYYNSLEEMTDNKEIEIVSLCSPVRKDQEEQAVLCMKKGKHVYAEKPCAFTEEGIRRLIRTAKENNVIFREMIGTTFQQPYKAMRKVIRQGLIGEPVQVFAQKSYRSLFSRRPQDEAIDGGLTVQVGVHATRMIEHITGLKITESACIETKLGNPVPEGQLRTASSVIGTLENGGIFSMVINYLNPQGFGLHGNESLRIFGTKGMMEATDGGTKTRLIVEDKDFGPLDTSEPDDDYFELFLDKVRGEGELPFDDETAMHPTIAIVNAKKNEGIWRSQKND